MQNENRFKVNKLLVDENISPKISDYLISLGYNSRHVRDVGLKGCLDEDIAVYSMKHGLVIITADQGFGQSFYLRNSPALGMVVLKSRSYKVQDIKNLIDLLHNNGLFKETLTGTLLVVSPNFVRKLTLR